MRILLDTNVLVAAFATRGFCLDILQLVLAEHRLVAGETVLIELERTLRDKLRMPDARIAEVVGFVREHADLAAPGEPAPWPDIDSDDRWIVATALAGSADVLVTGDRDLLDAGAAAPPRVVTPRGLWELLRAGGDPEHGERVREPSRSRGRDGG